MAQRRRRTKAFQDNPSLEFEFFLAKELGGMTVAEMRERMSGDEFTRWSIFYARKTQREELERLKAGR